jgi:Peroxide stress protein YaaA
VRRETVRSRATVELGISDIYVTCDMLTLDIGRRTLGLGTGTWDEYVAAIDMDLITQHCRFIKILFYEDSKIVSVHAKRARGLMVRYLSELKATALEQVQEFNVEGYTYVHEKSTDHTLVFNRPKNYCKPSSIGNKNLLSLDSSTGIANKRSKQR